MAIDTQLQREDLRRSSLKSTPRRFLGIVNRKERWGFSGRGWLILSFVAALIFYGFVFELYPFLAVTNRVDANVLVVEGWIHDYAIRSAVDEFKNGHYTLALTTGGPVAGARYVNDYQTMANIGAELLLANGLPRESVQSVPAKAVDRDRTYSSAVALRNWIQAHNLQVKRINVLTEDLHARRTRFLFQEALGRNVAVGIIAIPNPDYDAKHWWRYSPGVRDVFSEGVAYVYARMFFYPSEP